MTGSTELCFFDCNLTTFRQIAMLLSGPMPRISFCRRDLQSTQMTVYWHYINDLIMVDACIWSFIVTTPSPLEA